MNVAVIIPFWNGMRWIERAVDSVARQTCLPAEFYVVNDGSRPEERVQLDALAERYGFKILDQANGGQGSARNFGVAASTSELICFLDQDDSYQSDHIEKLLRAVPADLSKFAFAYGSFDIADSAGRIQSANHLVLKQDGLHPPPQNELELLGRNLYILPSASILSRDAFLRVGGFDCQFRGYEDDDLFSRLILAGSEYAFLPESVYIWCHHKDSTSLSPMMAKSRLCYYRKLRQAHVVAGRLSSRAIAHALMRRFGYSFYQSAVYAVKLGDSDGLDLRQFEEYLGDMSIDNLPWLDKQTYRLRFWLIRHASTFPISLFWKLKRFNRRRVEARRVRDGRQFLVG